MVYNRIGWWRGKSPKAQSRSKLQTSTLFEWHDSTITKIFPSTLRNTINPRFTHKARSVSRYLLDAKDKISASKEGMQLATSYYLAAQQVAPGAQLFFPSACGACSSNPLVHASESPCSRCHMQLAIPFGVHTISRKTIGFTHCYCLFEQTWAHTLHLLVLYRAGTCVQSTRSPGRVVGWQW